MGDTFGGFGDHVEFGDLADPKFEFAAPKFHDFFGESDEVPDDNADDWFSKFSSSFFFILKFSKDFQVFLKSF